MNWILLITVSIQLGLAGLILGILLGCFLGKIGSVQILAFILRMPIILIKSPKKLKEKWKMWRELKASRKVEHLKKQKEINELKKTILNFKEEIKKVKTQINHLKWKSDKS